MPDRSALDLARDALARPHAPFRSLPARVLVVDVATQRATLLEAGRELGSWPVSTARAGVGGEQDSGRTPPGWHRIDARIGAGADPSTIFDSRQPTGERWTGAADARDLILGRILWLDGLEPGVNQGPGHDSHDRYIYVHGTNHEPRLGTPDSHGCIRLARADMLALFERVAEGDPVIVVDEAPVPDPLAGGRFHYAGVAGSGMSALAQYQVMRGGRASGSDRGLDRGGRDAERARFEALGIAIVPQDGRGVADAAALVVSTAVERQVPDVAAALASGTPILHRAQLLAHWVAERPSMAVTGTSGKSTVVAMAFEILRGAGRDPSVITGGELMSLQRAGLPGNAWAGAGPLVVEADESDGSVVRYSPEVGVLLNLQRDHKEPAEVGAMFETFRGRVRGTLVVGEDAALERFAAGALRYGFGAGADVRGTRVTLAPAGSAFDVADVRFTLPVPGRHNVENALAAIAACRALGVPLQAMATPLERFAGVARRFQSIGAARGVEVVDDFAHNPAKLAAALATAHARARRVLAVFQPHGFGPTRFLWREFVETFASALAPDDRLWLLEIFYAGGTAERNLSSSDLAAEIVARGRHAAHAPDRATLAHAIAVEAQPGDLVLVMGARDPSLTALAQAILAALG
ncbi:MAG TPA: L,D-transpeptidase family protein [Candidatus Eisenbacteria bacterium]|nr:L,D-transpeptidase family protein [Candidatus Eisenbacteria bacterium]